MGSGREETTRGKHGPRLASCVHWGQGSTSGWWKAVAATFRGDSLQSPHFSHLGGAKRWTIDKTPVAAAPVRLRLRLFGVP